MTRATKSAICRAFSPAKRFQPPAHTPTTSTPSLASWKPEAMRSKEREEKQELLEAPGPEAFPAVDVGDDDGESKSKRKPKAKSKSDKPTGTVTTGDAPAKSDPPVA